jgi:hypothetical protein
MQIHNNTVYAIQNRVQEGWRFADTDPSGPGRPGRSPSEERETDGSMADR